MKKIVVGVTGASGAIYAYRLALILKKCDDVVAHFIFTEPAKAIFRAELGEEPEVIEGVNIVLNDVANMAVAFASGSNPADAVLVVPASANTMAKCSAGIADNLITRSVDVVLKERRKAIFFFRETPLNLTHINNMKSLTEAGAVVMPANPSFYLEPQSVEDIVDTMLYRLLDIAGVDISHKRYEGAFDA